MNTIAADVSTAPTRRIRNLLLAMAVVVGSFVALTVVPEDAHAAACCKVRREGKHLIITGTVSYKGANFMTAFIENSKGKEASGQRCSYNAGKGRTTIKIKVPAKYAPNGKWRVIAASANSDFTKYYSTPSNWFRIKK